MLVIFHIYIYFKKNLSPRPIPIFVSAIYRLQFTIFTRCDEVATWSRNTQSSFCLWLVSKADAKSLETT